MGGNAALPSGEAHQFGSRLVGLVERGDEAAESGLGQLDPVGPAKRSWAWSTAADNTNPDRLWPVSAAAWRRACSCSGDRRKLRRPVRVSGMYVM